MPKLRYCLTTSETLLYLGPGGRYRGPSLKRPALSQPLHHQNTHANSSTTQAGADEAAPLQGAKPFSCAWRSIIEACLAYGYKGKLIAAHGKGALNDRPRAAAEGSPPALLPTAMLLCVAFIMSKPCLDRHCYASAVFAASMVCSLDAEL